MSRFWTAALFTCVGFATSSAHAGVITFANATPIVIPGPVPGVVVPAAPYPSTILVAGFVGGITDLDLTLRDLTHTFPTDIDVLLIGPTGANLLFMSDTGSNVDIAIVTLTFDDAAAATLSFTLGITAGTYRPTNFDVLDTFPAPAPAGPYTSAEPEGTGTFLSVFGGTNPNGLWRLFVADDAGEFDGGTFANGWELTITANTVPEPASLLLFGGGALAAAARRFRRHS